MVDTLIGCYLGGEDNNFMRRAQELVAFHQYLTEHRTSSDTGLGQGCTSFLTGQSSSVVSLTRHLQKCNDYFLHIFSTEKKCCFLSQPSGSALQTTHHKKAGNLLVTRGCSPPTPDPEIRFCHEKEFSNTTKTKDAFQRKRA